MNRFTRRLRGKRITVIGAGRSGMAVTKLLQKAGANIFLSEIAPFEEKRAEAKVLEAMSVPFEFGEHSERTLEADWMVLSPGVPLSASVVQNARERGIGIWGELEVASWFCRSSMVAVTGSNGKSTTTALLGDMFRLAGKSTIVAGNIGKPFSGEVENSVSDGVAVLEVSSFQLETIDQFHPQIAVFLNLTPDHLDRHHSFDHYGEIKARIFQNQTPDEYLVYNGQDETVTKLAQRAKSRKVLFNKYDRNDWCGFVREQKLWVWLGESEEVLVAIEEMTMRGAHNIQNGLAAALVACLMHVDVNIIREALRIFRGLPHRMEFVREVNGVCWVNDSKATNVDAAWYALGSYSHPLVLIAGGRDKDADFTLLRKRIQEKTRGVILMGEAADKMEKAFKNTQPVFKVNSLEEAFKKAQEISYPGDVVLFSPACASFDMFRDFEDRGNQFKALVDQLS